MEEQNLVDQTEPQVTGLSERLEQEERSAHTELEFVALWSERLRRAQDARVRWDKDYIDCENVLSNNIPLNTGGSDDAGSGALDEGTDSIYKVNPTITALHWKTSYLQQADMGVTLNGENGTTFNDKALLEAEVNDAFDRFDVTRKSIQAIYELGGFGYGVDYLGWDVYAKQKEWGNGTPLNRNVHCRRFWVDENATAPNWTDRRWSFELIQLDIEDAKVHFPEFAKDFTESPADSSHGDSTDKKGIVDVYLVQYKKKKRYKMVESKARTSEGTRTYFSTLDDIRIAKTKHNIPDDDRTGANIKVSKEFEVKNDEWFQFYYSDDLGKVLSPVEHIGKRDHYSIMHGFKIGGDIYPRSTVYLMKDVVDIRCQVLTKAVIDMVSNGTPILLEREGALVNSDEFKKNVNSFNPHAIISDEWAATHIGEKAVEFEHRTVDNQLTLVIANLIDQAIKDINGNVDSMRGVPQFSNMSGIQTAQLQVAGQIFTKSDELAFRDFMTKKAQILLSYIGEYKTYEHIIANITTDGQIAGETVNQNDEAAWDWEHYYPTVSIENNPEAIKQLRETRDNNWFAQGLLHPVDLMERAGEPNAQKLWQHALEYRDLLRVSEAIAKNPNLVNIIMTEYQRQEAAGMSPAQGEEQQPAA